MSFDEFWDSLDLAEWVNVEKWQALAIWNAAKASQEESNVRRRGRTRYSETGLEKRGQLGKAKHPPSVY